MNAVGTDQFGQFASVAKRHKPGGADTMPGIARASVARHHPGRAIRRDGLWWQHKYCGPARISARGQSPSPNGRWHKYTPNRRNSPRARRHDAKCGSTPYHPQRPSRPQLQRAKGYFADLPAGASESAILHMCILWGGNAVRLNVFCRVNIEPDQSLPRRLAFGRIAHGINRFVDHPRGWMGDHHG